MWVINTSIMGNKENENSIGIEGLPSKVTNIRLKMPPRAYAKVGPKIAHAMIMPGDW